MPTISLTISDLSVNGANAVLAALAVTPAEGTPVPSAPAADKQPTKATTTKATKTSKPTTVTKEPELPAAEEGDTTDTEAAGGDPFGLGEAEEPAEEFTLDQIKVAAAAFMKAKQAPALEKVIISFKKADGKPAAKMSEVQPQDYAAFMQKVAL